MASKGWISFVCYGSSGRDNSRQIEGAVVFSGIAAGALVPPTVQMRLGRVGYAHADAAQETNISLHAHSFSP